MTNTTPKKLTRRDAIKILGAAAGATVLANLPSKWSAPELTSGVLPAHAQTSILYALTCAADNPFPTWTFVSGGKYRSPSSVTISPTTPDINLNYSVNVASGDAALSSPASGAVLTSGGAASIMVEIDISTALFPAGIVQITWSFGGVSCIQALVYSFT